MRQSHTTGRAGYTLLEMLTTIAALIIVLGLMVGLARSVRSASAQELTKDLPENLSGLIRRQLQAVFSAYDRARTLRDARKAA